MRARVQVSGEWAGEAESGVQSVCEQDNGAKQEQKVVILKISAKIEKGAVVKKADGEKFAKKAKKGCQKNVASASHKP